MPHKLHHVFINKYLSAVLGVTAAATLGSLFQKTPVDSISLDFLSSINLIQKKSIKDFDYSFVVELLNKFDISANFAKDWFNSKIRISKKTI